MQWHEDANTSLGPHLVALARQAVARRPTDAAGWLKLAYALREAGEPREALGCLAEATRHLPTHAALRLAHARALKDAGALGAALDEAEGALEQAPDDVGARLLRYELLRQMRQDEAAAQFDGDIAALAAQHKLFVVPRAHALLRDGAAEQLLALCDGHLAHRPGHTSAQYYRAMALAKLGRDAQARAALALDRFVDLATLAAPPGVPGMAQFCDDLAAQIGRNPTLIPDPRGLATRSGLQTQRLRQPDAPAVDLLLAQIKTHVDAYVARLGGAPHGFLAARPERARLHAWAVVCGAQGHQAPHHHAPGWLSGVFYVAAPRPAAQTAYGGALMLGAVSSEKYGFAPPWGTRAVEPVPGSIVLFPSYVSHATAPSGLDEPRIVVSFDVVPLD
ncbi:MAG TPA: putative 2OG-Fe(II) oxygenase [Rhizomicrobium sp.]|jgi:uncharacterized protein (TIGR02466 family)|nr:putative 2OG-Fe(II) oxygenase [Rhizomicrobium sp.]